MSKVSTTPETITNQPLLALHDQFADFLSSTSYFNPQQGVGKHVFLQDHLPLF
jgi:hypothetical protein